MMLVNPNLLGDIMQTTFFKLAMAISLCATSALAADATDPAVVAQKTLMKTFGGAAKTLGEMAGGASAFDAAAAQAAKDALVAGAADIAMKFEKAGNDPASEASPAIWTNWDDFMTKAKAMGDAAGALDVASLDGIKAGMGAIGASCKGCHTTYRVKK
jgi:cytochrome c556